MEGPSPPFRPFSSDDTPSRDALLNFWARIFPICHVVVWTGLQHCAVFGQKSNLDDLFAPKAESHGSAKEGTQLGLSFLS